MTINEEADRILQQEVVTVCLECRFFHNSEPNSTRSHIWYNHFCMAAPFPKTIDPYDGKLKPCQLNSLGDRYFPNHPYKFCRDINDGRCPHFERK